MVSDLAKREKQATFMGLATSGRYDIGTQSEKQAQERLRLGKTPWNLQAVYFQLPKDHFATP
jgi:hypothetical protein